MASRPLPMAWHNGELLPLADVSISPLDRGFLFGDGVYEVIPFYAGQAFGYQRHWRRLLNSLKAIALPLGVPSAAFKEAIDALITANDGGDQALYLQVSRAGDHGRDHRFPDAQVSNLFMMSNRLAPLDVAAYRRGFDAVLANDERWARCDIKSVSLLANVLARQRASEATAIEAILTRDGQITEGAASAIACVIDGELLAPAESRALLPSVTRAIVWELAERLGIPTGIRPISTEALLAADEVMMMSSTKEIAPIVHVDGRSIGEGKPGPVWQRLFEAYQQEKAALHER